METSQAGIYAIGDVTGPPLLAHLASAQGLLVANNIAGREFQLINKQCFQYMRRSSALASSQRTRKWYGRPRYDHGVSL